MRPTGVETGHSQEQALVRTDLLHTLVIAVPHFERRIISIEVAGTGIMVIRSIIVELTLLTNDQKIHPCNLQDQH